MIISSQDFRNTYQKFYNDVRQYLWPYNVIEEIATVQDDIFTAFIDIEQLRNDFRKLYKSIKEAIDEDEFLNKSYKELSELIENEYENPYLKISRVEEVNPDEDKQIRTIPEEDEEDSELNESNQTLSEGLGLTD